MTKSGSKVSAKNAKSTQKDTYIQKKPSQIKRMKKYKHDQNPPAVNKDGRPITASSDDLKGIFPV
jgi:hypothetical protein